MNSDNNDSHIPLRGTPDEIALTVMRTFSERIEQKLARIPRFLHKFLYITLTLNMEDALHAVESIGRIATLLIDAGYEFQLKYGKGATVAFTIKVISD